MKMYEVKKNLTKKELSQLLLLTRKIHNEAKGRGVEMSKTAAKHHALEYLGWTGYENEDEIVVSQTFREGQKTTNPRYHKSV